MFSRMLVVALLLSGCSGSPSLTVPGKSARDVVLASAMSTAKSLGYPERKSQCITQSLSASLTDDEFRQVEAALSNGADSQLYMRAINTAMTACP